MLINLVPKENHNLERAVQLFFAQSSEISCQSLDCKQNETWDKKNIGKIQFCSYRLQRKLTFSQLTGAFHNFLLQKKKQSPAFKLHCQQNYHSLTKQVLYKGGIEFGVKITIEHGLKNFAQIWVFGFSFKITWLYLGQVNETFNRDCVCNTSS